MLNVAYDGTRKINFEKTTSQPVTRNNFWWAVQDLNL